MNEWYEDDAFWAVMAPFLFEEARWIGTEAEIDFVLALAGVGAGKVALDLGCGPGRHALELARRGLRVTGVDRTTAYLRQAREKAQQEELDVEFVESDMRAFRRPDTYDLALSLFTTFGYFEEAADNQRVLRNLHEALRQGGVLLMEMSGKEVLARKFQARDWVEQEGIFLLEERSVIDNWSRAQNTWTVLGAGEQRSFTFRHWIYSGVELQMLLHEAGFSAVEIYGDLEGRPYDQEARRLVALARK